MTEIRLENISHSYDGEEWAVRNVDMTLEDGSVTGLLGPSGCGKTTLLKIITGLLDPTEGRVYFDGEDVTEMDPQDRNVAMCFQFPTAYNMNVKENLKFPLKVGTDLSEDEIEERVKHVAEVLELTDMLDEPRHTLGAAEKQRIAIGRALARDPALFLFDEPLSSIEPDKRDDLKVLIEDAIEEVEQTTVYVTHDQTEALTFARKVALMKDGEILQYDTVEKLFEEPEYKFIGYFLGSPGMNFLRTDVVDGKLRSEDMDYEMDMPDFLKGRGMDRIDIGIRPENIDISDEERKGYVPMNIGAIERTGKGFNVIHLAGEVREEAVKCRTSIDFQKGDTAYVRFSSESLQYFDPDTGKRLEA